MTINNLQEGSYGFSVYTYDKQGRSSVAAKTLARAYGAIFISTFFSPIAGTTIITNCKVTEPITYRSVFMPELMAIDKFYTSYTSL